SEMLAYELQTAHEAALAQAGKPKLLPVRINYTEPLPEPLRPFLDPLQYALWQGPQDNERLLSELTSALRDEARSALGARRSVGTGAESVSIAFVEAERRAPSAERGSAATSTHPLSRPTGGVVPLDSPFYVVRPCDEAFREAIAQQDSVILVKGARQ